MSAIVVGNRPIHIRIIAGRLDRHAGSHIYNNNLARRLAARGYQVSVVCHKGEEEVGDVCEQYEVGFPPESRTFLWRFKAYTDYRFCLKAMRHIDLPRPDIVVGTRLMLLREHAHRFRRVPWIYLPHGLIVQHELDLLQLPPFAKFITRCLYTGLQKWALRNADRTIRFTHYGCRLMEQVYGKRTGARFLVNPIGIDLPTLHQPVANSNCNPNKKLRLLSVGRLVPIKRVHVILDALGSLKEFNWELDIVGSGNEVKKLKAQMIEKKIADRVHFHGQVDDIGRFYRQADLVLMTSRSESLGLVVLEAMSYAVPVLALKPDNVEIFNPNDEIIDDGLNGYLANSDDHFRQRLRELLTQPSGVLSRTGANARAKIVCNYTWERHLDVYEELFATLVK